MRKRIFQLVFFALLLFAGIIALTQEMDDSVSLSAPEEDIEIYSDEFLSELEQQRELPEWIKPARWFRSNAGGMALEEIPSKLAALRNKYALVIDFATEDELPSRLLQFYDSAFYIEVRTLFENGRETRTQWIFRDINWTTRVLAVLIDEDVDAGIEEADEAAITDDETENGAEIAKADDSMEEAENMQEDEITEETVLSEETIEYADAELSDEKTDEMAALINTDEQNIEDMEENDSYKKIIGLKNGFVEVYDENAYLTMEYRFSNEDQDSKTEFFYKNSIIISAETSFWEDRDNGGLFVKSYIDYFRYNRSAFLRNVERFFYKDKKITFSDDSIRIAFPGNVMNAARNEYFMSEKFNQYPEFFGNLFAIRNDRLVYSTDDRGRILNQTLYRKQINSETGEEEDAVVWAINNVWSGERIVSIKKTEGDIVLLAEYEFNSSGDRVLERNIKNGVLERLVRTEGKKDIEQLYLDNTVVLQAVYEDGRKISETRMK